MTYGAQGRDGKTPDRREEIDEGAEVNVNFA